MQSMVTMIILATRLPNANSFGLPEVAVPSRATSTTTRLFCLMWLGYALAMHVV